MTVKKIDTTALNYFRTEIMERMIRLENSYNEQLAHIENRLTAVEQRFADYQKALDSLQENANYLKDADFQRETQIGIIADAQAGADKVIMAHGCRLAELERKVRDMSDDEGWDRLIRLIINDELDKRKRPPFRSRLKASWRALLA
jgi:chromosome segregation ATPase